MERKSLERKEKEVCKGEMGPSGKDFKWKSSGMEECGVDLLDKCTVEGREMGRLQWKFWRRELEHWEGKEARDNRIKRREDER